MFLFDWAAPLNDIQLFSFFNTAPVWHLFVICYLITFWFMFFKNQVVLFYFLVPFLGQFFFLNSSFSIEHVLFFSNTNPLLNNSLNYLHPLIMNTLYVASLLSLILPFWFFISIIPVRESILAPLPLLRQFYSLTLCLLLALVFGTFWAAQLDTWGGWWVWDSSEILLIQFLLVLIVGFHAWPKYFCFSWFCLPYGFFFYYLVSWGYTFIDPTLTLHTFTAVQSLFFSNFIFLLFTGIHFIFIFQLFFEYRKQGTYLPLFSKYLFVLTFVFLGFIYCKWSFFIYLFLYFLVISTQPLILKINNLIYLTHLFISWSLIFFVTTLSSPTILNLNVTDNYYLIRLSFFNDLIFSSGHFFFYNQFIVIDYSLSVIHSAIEKRLVGVSVNYRFWV